MRNSRVTRPGFFGPRTMPARQAYRSLPRRPVSRGSDIPSGLRARSRVAVSGRQTRLARESIEAQKRLVQRLTMGSTPQELARIETLGYEKYLDEQLDYESIDNSELEELLSEHLPTVSMSAAELIDNYEEDPFVPILELWLATIYRSLYSPRQLFERRDCCWFDWVAMRCSRS